MSVKDEFLKVAKEKGWLDSPIYKKAEEKKPSDYEANLRALRPVKTKYDDKEDHIMEIAHPEPVYVIPAHDKMNSIFENEIERSNLMKGLLNKQPTGALTQHKYAEDLATTLQKIAIANINDSEIMNQISNFDKNAQWWRRLTNLFKGKPKLVNEIARRPGNKRPAFRGSKGKPGRAPSARSSLSRTLAPTTSLLGTIAYNGTAWVIGKFGLRGFGVATALSLSASNFYSLMYGRNSQGILNDIDSTIYYLKALITEGQTLIGSRLETFVSELLDFRQTVIDVNSLMEKYPVEDLSQKEPEEAAQILERDESKHLEINEIRKGFFKEVKRIKSLISNIQIQIKTYSDQSQKSVGLQKLKDIQEDYIYTTSNSGQALLYLRTLNTTLETLLDQEPGIIEKAKAGAKMLTQKAKQKIQAVKERYSKEDQVDSESDETVEEVSEDAEEDEAGFLSFLGDDTEEEEV